MLALLAPYRLPCVPRTTRRPQLLRPSSHAVVTNRRYHWLARASGWPHHMLAKRGIMWESEEHLRFADDARAHQPPRHRGLPASWPSERGAYE